MEDYHVLILAAGKSTRIQSVTQGRSKVLLSVAGKSLLRRNLDWLADNGIQRVFVNVHYETEAIRAHCADYSRLVIHWLYEPALLGTAGALANAAKFVNDQKPWLVVYGDNFFHVDLQRLEEQFRKKKPSVLIALFNIHHNQHAGIAGGRVDIDSLQRVKGFYEGSDANELEWVNAGIYWFNASIVSLIQAHQWFDFGKDVFPYLLKENDEIQAGLLQPNEYCLGLDTPESYQRSLEIIKGTKL